MATKYTKEILEAAVKESKSVMEVMRRIGIKKMAGGSHSWISKKIQLFGIDTSHFLGQAIKRGVASPNRLTATELLVNIVTATRIKASKLRRALLEIGVELKCALCGIAVWNDKTITLEIDHINGKIEDNRRENLRFLCPNCHSQTDNYGNKRRR